MSLGASLGIGWCGCGGASSYVCNDTLVQGEGSLVDNTILLNPNGGVLTIMFHAPGVGTVDKLEIYHGNPTNGTKVATTGMTTLNAGPFDNVYGTVSTGDVIPTEAQALATDQFIGSSKGTVPTRATAYTAETGIANPLVAPFEQLVWWVYTPADYQVSSYANIRVTGPVGTKWSFKPYCESPSNPGVEICNLIWTDTNSSETELTAGGNLPILTNQTDWSNAWQAQTPAACYIDFDSNNSSYGLIYNYWGRLEVKKPPGFRLPTQGDYNTITSSPCFTGATLNRYGANPGVWDPSLLTDTTELGDSGFNSQGYGHGVFNFATGVVTFPYFGVREAYWLGSIDATSKGFGFIVNSGYLNGLGYSNATTWMLFVRFVKDA